MSEVRGGVREERWRHGRMDSPQMYDLEDSKKHLNLNLIGASIVPSNNNNNNNLLKGSAVAVKSLPSCLYSDEPGADLAELSAPELSLDLHNLINESEGLLAEIGGLLEGGKGRRRKIYAELANRAC